MRYVLTLTEKTDNRELRGQMECLEFPRSLFPQVDNLSPRLLSDNMEHTGKMKISTIRSYSDEKKRYHSHSAGQIMDGLYGPIYIR